ncbi:hypothetical protein [Yoonia sp.]|uniref:hypothetical protein n=1 Tax=Yoonia sp. TaxID=2212373 RepID=UPI0039191B6F
MRDQRQILDVTYGTFSCRLEGFDDSVATLKQVATYFRDNAAFVGASDVPPQDADIAALATLTSEGHDGDVDGTLHEGKISLRLSHEAATGEGHLPLRMPPPAIADQGGETEMSDALQEDDTSPEQHFKSDEDADGADDAVEDTDSVAAKMQRIRDVVSNGVPSEAQDDAMDDLPETTNHATDHVNPLSARLAALAQRNASEASREAGIAAESETTDPTADQWGDPDDDSIQQEDLEDLEMLDGVDHTETAITATEEDDSQEIDSAADPHDDELTLANIVQSRSLNLHDELAEVERQIDDRNKRQELTRATDAAVSRILMQTDTHLNTPETRRQHDSIAQLKAAVAATEAARQLGEGSAPRERLSEIFRHDLGEISAQEHNRSMFASDVDDESDDLNDEDNLDASDEEARSPAPQASLPPLRLVASQRIVSPAKADSAASSRLREIASKVDTSQAKPVSFADFAHNHNAAGMAEMFEAAAAYTTFVTRQADFSRPQIMGLVRSAMPRDFSRKDGLQTFGKLVQNERIIKLENGRFQVAPDTRFRMDDRAARG